MEKVIVRVESENKEIIYSDVIRPFSKKDNTFKIFINELVYEFIFKDDSSVNSAAKLEIENMLNLKGWRMIFKNYKNSIGISNIEPINIGYVNNHNIYLNYSIYDISGYKNIFVTLYMDKQERKND